MTRDFQGVKLVMLEQNYRSTQSILRTSIQIMSQGMLCLFSSDYRLSSRIDKNRIDKSLYSGHHEGFTPSLTTWSDEKEEGDYIAQEIKRLIAHSGGMLKFSDFAVLRMYLHISLRDRSLTRAHPLFPSAFQRSVPCHRDFTPA